MKKIREYSTRENDDFKDISSYWSKLSACEKEWLQANYIDPEIMQKVDHLPQDQRRRIWTESKRTKRCIGGLPDQCLYLADIESLFTSASHQESGTDLDIEDFFNLLKIK